MRLLSGLAMSTLDVLNWVNRPEDPSVKTTALKYRPSSVGFLKKILYIGVYKSSN